MSRIVNPPIPGPAYPVATNGNRTNSQAKFSLSPLGKSSLFITQTLLAGASIPLPCTGTTFYLISATGSLFIQPTGANENAYGAGQGLRLPAENAFSQLQVRNGSGGSVTFTLFVGFDEYLDQTFVLNAASIAAIIPFRGNLAPDFLTGNQNLAAGARFASIYNDGAVGINISFGGGPNRALPAGQTLTLPSIAEGLYPTINVQIGAGSAQTLVIY